MPRYIDADALLHRLHDDLPYKGSVKRVIMQAPTEDVEEVKHGEWILTKKEFGWNCAEYPSEYTCSVCGRTEKQQEPYCHCGAKMDGGNNNG